MLKIGDVLILEDKYSEKYEQFKCKLVEMKGNDLYIDYPVNMSTNRTVFLLEGSPLRVNFNTDSGGHFYFDTEVKGRVKHNIAMVVLSFPGIDNLVKIQRRQYVRVETSVDVAVHSPTNRFSSFTTITDDISAGGAAILASKTSGLKEGMKIDTWFVLPMQNGLYEYKKFLGKIVRILEAGQNKNKVSVQFEEPTASDKQLLIRFCFERQLSMKKKGL